MLTVIPLLLTMYMCRLSRLGSLLLLTVCSTPMVDLMLSVLLFGRLSPPLSRVLTVRQMVLNLLCRWVSLLLPMERLSLMLTLVSKT